MNKLIIASLVAGLAGITGTPNTAKAGNELGAAIGGFIGGVIVGSAANDHRDHRPSSRSDYGRYSNSRGGVVIEVAPRAHGRWEWVEVRAFVPGRYATSYDRRGRECRSWIPGRHEIRRERVWVDFDRSHGHRSGGYAYGRR